MLRILTVGLVVCGLGAIALAWPDPGVKLDPGTYHLQQTEPTPPPDYGGDLLVGDGPGPAWWEGNNGEHGDTWWIWWDDLKNAYELPSGDYLFFYPGGTWIRTNGQGQFLARGTY